MASKAVNGLAVGLVAVGGVMVLSGLRNASPLDTLRALVKGQPLPSGAPYVQTGSATGFLKAGSGSGTGAQAESAARGHIGKPYEWAAEGPNTFDCSGLVTYVLHTQLGLDLPDNHHTTTYGFWDWDGAVDVPRDQMQPGDLVCWWSHMGIASSTSTMIHAPGIGRKVEEAPIWWVPAPQIRRPKAYMTAAAETGTRSRGYIE